jgi:hypothetical protein
LPVVVLYHVYDVGSEYQVMENVVEGLVEHKGAMREPAVQAATGGLPKAF